MINSNNKWAVLLGMGVLAYAVSFGATPIALALTVTTTGSTSTFISVFVNNVATLGYSSFTFVSSTKLFTVNGTSSLQGVTFTNATGTGNLQSATLNVTGLSTLQGFAFTNSTGTGNLQIATFTVTGKSSLQSVSSTNLTASGYIQGSSLNISGQSSLASVSSTNFSSTGYALVAGDFNVSGQTTLVSASTTNMSASGYGLFPTLVFTNASGTNLTANGYLQGGLLNISGTSALQGVTFANATGTGNLQVGTLVVTGTSTLNSFVFINPLGATSGGTGQNSYAKGDLLVASASTTIAKLGVGSSGQVLMASSTAANGVSWEALPISSAQNGLTLSVTFGEDVNTGDAVYMSDGSTESAKHFQVDVGSTLTTNLVSYYKFINNANDFFGSNNLTISGPSYSADGPDGGSGNSYDWGSSDLNNNVMTLGSAIVGDTYSISVWVKRNGSPTNAYIVDQVNQNQIQIYSGTSPAYVVRADSTNDSNAEVPNGSWSHIVITRSGISGVLKIYQDGVLTKSGTATANTPGNLYIGNHNGGGTGWVGKIAELGFWNKVLSSQEITDLYNSGQGQTMIPAMNNGTAGKVYAASAADHIYSNGFIGFAVATTTAGNVGNVVIGGITNSVSINLNAGKQYYLGNSSGTLSTIPGAVTRKVGIGINTTTLDITNIW